MLKRFFLFIILSTLFHHTYAQWQLCNGPYGGNVVCIERSQLTGKVFAGTQTGGLFAKDADSSVWLSLQHRFPNNDSRILDLHYTDSKIFAMTDLGVYHSTDEGLTWSTIPVDSGFIPGGVMYCQDSVIIVNGYPKKLYISTNSGSIFYEVANNLSDSTKFFYDVCMVGSRVFLLSSLNVGYFNTISISDDFGSTWTKPVTDVHDSNFWGDLKYNRLRVLSDGIYAMGMNSVYKSTDNGLNWYQQSFPGKPANSGATDIFKSGNTTLVATNNQGVYISDDGGINFSLCSNGFPLLKCLVNEFQVIPTGELLSASNLGVFISSNTGHEWSDANKGMNAMSVNCIISHQQNLVTGSSGQGVHLSSDFGITWERKNQGLETASFFQQVLALVSADSLIIGGTNNEIYVSADLADSWEHRTAGLQNSVSLLHKSGPRIYAGTPTGFYYSSDGANSFNLFNILPGGSVMAIFAEDSIVIVQNEHAFSGPVPVHYFMLRRSSDFGNTFENVDSLSIFKDIERINHTLLGANRDKAFAKSFDNGFTWLIDSFAIQEPVCDFFVLESKYVFASTINGQVYRSDDSASTWINITNNYVGRNGKFARSGNYLFISSQGSGIWRMDISTLPGMQILPALESHIIFPNPNNGIFEIGIPESMVNTGMMQLTIYDMIGKLVYKKDFNTNVNFLHIETQLNQGVYAVSLQGKFENHCSKIQVLKDR